MQFRRVNTTIGSKIYPSFEADRVTRSEISALFEWCVSNIGPGADSPADFMNRVVGVNYLGRDTAWMYRNAGVDGCCICLNAETGAFLFSNRWR
jgi:hypothetical protein